MRVRDVMTADVVTVRPEATLKDVAALLAEHGISGVPVVGDAGELLGVVSKTDILVKQRGPAAAERGGLLGLLRGDSPATAVKAEARIALEAMTAPVVAIDEERPVAAAAALMLDHRVNRLPVLRQGRLAGIVTRSDLVRAFARSDEAIAHEVREEIVHGMFWVPEGSVTVAVEDGVVRLAGEVETQADAEMLPQAVRRAAGVVDVESDLRWRVPGRPEFERRRA